MNSVDIRDGVEMRTRQHLISIGHQVHRYVKDATEEDGPVDEKPINVKPLQRSADELAAFFKAHPNT